MTKIYNLVLLSGMWGFISLLHFWKFSWFALAPPSPMLWDFILSNSTNKIQRLTCCCISSGLVQILCHFANLLILLCSIHKNAYFNSHNWLDCFKYCKFTSSLLLLEEDLNGIYHILNYLSWALQNISFPQAGSRPGSPKNVNIFLFPPPPPYPPQTLTPPLWPSCLSSLARQSQWDQNSFKRLVCVWLLVQRAMWKASFQRIKTCGGGGDGAGGAEVSVWFKGRHMISINALYP